MVKHGLKKFFNELKRFKMGQNNPMVPNSPNCSKMVKIAQKWSKMFLNCPIGTNIVNTTVFIQNTTVYAQNTTKFA